MTPHEKPFVITKTSFEKFCRSKPKDEEYRADDNLNCAFSQFVKTLGQFEMVTAGTSTVYAWLGESLSSIDIEIPMALRETIWQEPRTFGSLANRVKKTRSQRSDGAPK